MSNKLIVLKGRNRIIATVLALFTVVIQSSFAQQSSSNNLGEVSQVQKEVAGKLVFIENKGQWPAHVLFRTDFPGGQMLATPQGMLIGKYDAVSLEQVSKYEGLAEEVEKGLKPGVTMKDLGPEPVLKGHGWRFNFLGGNLANSQTLEKKEQAAEYFNFFIGAPSSFATNVHGYSDLIYKDVYKGIDVR